MGTLGAAPSVGVLSTGEKDVFWDGTDNGLWYATWLINRWYGPYEVSPNMGPLGLGPAVGVFY